MIAGSDRRLEEITGFDEGPRVDHKKEWQSGAQISR